MVLRHSLSATQDTIIPLVDMQIRGSEISGKFETLNLPHLNHLGFSETSFNCLN